jgi:hypothetical protein
MLSRFCLIFILTLSKLCAGDLYSILLCDTAAMNIGDSIEMDLKNMRDEVTRIQWYTNLRLVETEFSGENLIPSNVFQYVENLQLNPDDVVIFFFTGHGYRTRSKIDNPWPNLFCSITGQGIDYHYITKLIEEKNPALLLSICDCCNNILPESSAPEVVSKDLIAEGFDSRTRRNYEKLFLETFGVIRIRSSDVGEYSWCNSQGAVFLTAFLESFQKHARNDKEASWEDIFNTTTSKVLKLQTPAYEVY